MNLPQRSNGTSIRRAYSRDLTRLAMDVVALLILFQSWTLSDERVSVKTTSVMMPGLLSFSLCLQLQSPTPKHGLLNTPDREGPALQNSHLIAVSLAHSGGRYSLNRCTYSLIASSYIHPPVCTFDLPAMIEPFSWLLVPEPTMYHIQCCQCIKNIYRPCYETTSFELCHFPLSMPKMDRLESRPVQ